MSEFALEDRGDGRFAVTGDLSFDTAQNILRESDGRFGKHASLEVDLSGVKRADSAGLALLLEWKAQAAQRDASIRYTGTPDSLLAIAKTAELADLI